MVKLQILMTVKANMWIARSEIVAKASPKARFCNKMTQIKVNKNIVLI